MDNNFESKLREMIKEIFHEVAEEIDENGTANIQGFETPHAFKKKNKNSRIDKFGKGRK